MTSMFTVYAYYGGTKHVYDLQPAQIFKAIELDVVSQVFINIAISTGKVSVALLIYRLQAPCRWRTWVLAFLSTSSFVIAILVVTLIFAQCSPTRALWDLTLQGKCWKSVRGADWDIAASSK